MSMDSWFPNPHDKDIAQLEEGLAYRAVKSGNNWILPSGKNAANGDPVVLDGVFGYATAAIVGGTDAIVEDTNWKPYGDGGALGALNSKIVEYTGISKTVNLINYNSSSNPYYTESDGLLVCIINSSSADMYVNTFDENGNGITFLRVRAVDGGQETVYLKKGFPIWIDTNYGRNNVLKFYAFK